MSIFGFKKKKGDELHHWFTFIENFNLSPSEFYSAVEKELDVLKMPSMDMSRVEFAEGGPLSGKRVYLRMVRERLVFDTCAAPFGTGYFFSVRAVLIPAVVKLWHVAVVVLLFGGIFGALLKPLGPSFALLAVATLVLAIVQVFRSEVAQGLANLDSTLIKTPILGPIYEAWFRRETYYRKDTRMCYLEAVPKIVKRLAEEATGAKGIKLTRQYEKGPILGELYKPVSSPETPK